jgi:hypothetical protein
MIVSSCALQRGLMRLFGLSQREAGKGGSAGCGFRRGISDNRHDRRCRIAQSEAAVRRGNPSP